MQTEVSVAAFVVVFVYQCLLHCWGSQKQGVNRIALGNKPESERSCWGWRGSASKVMKQVGASEEMEATGKSASKKLQADWGPGFVAIDRYGVGTL